MTVLEPVIGWLIISKKKRVTLGQVMAGSDRPRKPVLRVMDRLVREGYAEEISDGKFALAQGEFGPMRRNPTWKILSTPLAVPRNQAKRRTLRDKIWQLVRAKRHFTLVQIQRLSGGAYDTVRIYMNMLERDGYVRRTGKEGGRITWMLIRGHNQTKRPVTKEKNNG